MRGKLQNPHENKLATKILVAILLLCTIGATVPLSLGSTSAAPISQTNSNLDFFLDENVYSNVLDRITFLSNLGSRVTGYEGNYRAAQYIIDEFTKLGLSVQVQKFNVTVPIDLGSDITILEPITATINAHAVWPNGVQPSPTKELEGPLVYVKGGSLSDFDGKNITDSIVLMEFNSSSNWLYGVDLGAKAVIFIEPSDSSSSESLKKFVEAPVYFPKLFVKRDDGQRLKNLVQNSQSEVRVKINLRMEWRTVETQNIIATLNGTGNPGDVVVLTSHYDSWSVVPAISYGASDAAGVSWLIELARYFSVNKPVRSLWFVAFSAHWQAMAGEREFVDEMFFSDQVQSGSVKPWVFIGLGPFSGDSSNIQLLDTSFYAGSCSSELITSDRFTWIQRRITQSYLLNSELRLTVEELTGRNLDPTLLVEERLSTTSMWWGTIQQPIMLESEIPLTAGCVSFNILSSPASTYSKYIGSPVNDLGLIDIENLKPQFLVSGFIVSSILNDNEWSLSWASVKPVRSVYVGSSIIASQNAGFITLNGKVLFFNNSLGWYDPISNALVQVQMTTMNNPLAKIITMADENGSFQIRGITPYTLTYNKGGWETKAWIIDKETGNILYAPDLGVQGGRVFASTIFPMSHPAQVSAVVAELRAITVLGLLDPRYDRPLMVLDPRFNSLVSTDIFVSVSGFIRPIEFSSKSDLLTYGAYYNPWETVGMVFVPPSSKSVILLKIGGTGASSLSWPTFLTNSTDEEPEGAGVSISNDSITIPFSIYAFASDMFRATKSRYEKLTAYNVRSLSIEKALDESQKNLALAESLFDSKNYSEAYGYATLSYSWSTRAYNEVMAIINEAGTSITILFILAIIVSFVVERILVQATKGLVRLLFIVGFTVLSIITMSLIHPAYTVMSNAIVANIGSVLMIMFVISLGILAIEAEKMSKALSVRYLGKHGIEKARLGVIALASSISANFIRKHRLRAVLTFLTVFIVSTAITSITCMAPYIGVKISPKSLGTLDLLYPTQLFLKNGQGLPQNDIYSAQVVEVLNQVLKDKFVILPRVVYYPQTIFRYGVYQGISSQTQTSYIRAILGVSPAESVFQQNLTSGRFFAEDDFLTCILSSAQADALNVEVGDKISTGSYELVVVGIFDESALSQLREPNGLQFGVPDPSYNSYIAKDMAQPLDPGATIPLLSWELVLVVPQRFAFSLGGFVQSIVAVPVSFEITSGEIQEIASNLVLTLDLNISFVVNGLIFSASRLPLYVTFGFESLMVLVVIAALNIAVTILSSIRERNREIQVFAVTGLTPLGSMSMFILESEIYAVVGGFLGYFAGFGLNTAFRNFGLLPSEIPFNHISSTTMLTIVIILVVSFVTSLWPSFSASKSVTPSLLRKWEFTTEPGQDDWEIPIPSRASSREEAISILRFLKEFFDGAGNVGHMFMITETKNVMVEDATLKLVIRQAPYELLILSDVEIRFVADTEGYSTQVYLKRTSGDRKAWIVSSYYFVDSMRKQLLLWRSLDVADRRRFLND
jgi:ABC-type antimicrobial peptide transport system permease subunit